MLTKRERIVDYNEQEKVAIRCKTSGRLNARIDEQGIYVFCRQCNTQHLLQWDDLALLRQKIQSKECEKSLYI